MFNIKLFIISCIICLASFSTEALWTITFIITLCSAILLAVSSTITAHIMLSMKHKVRLVSLTSYSNFHKCLLERYIIQAHKAPERLPVIFGRSVDFALQDLLDLIVCDIITPWLKDLSISITNVQHLIKKEIWLAISRLHERLTNIDETKLIAVDVVSKVTCHFEKIRSVQTCTMIDHQGIFYLSNHLISQEKELNYLRKASEFILSVLFSKSLTSHSLNKNLLIELSACRVLFPLAILVTDPNYINMKILEVMAHFVENHNLHHRKCTLAESYQEFLQLIEKSDDIDHLKHVRYSIMTEIMQATTVQNLRKTKEMDKEFYHSNVKNLKRYLGQLTHAKTRCEARLKCLGYPSSYEKFSCVPGDFEKKSVPLEKVLESVYGRKMLSKFLESYNQEYLLVYWIAVEELRATDRINWHQIAAEIYYTFVHPPTAPLKTFDGVCSKKPNIEENPSSFSTLQLLFLTSENHNELFKAIPNVHHICNNLELFHLHLSIEPEKYSKLVEKSIRRRMENFLLGNSGPEAFYEVQDIIVDVLKRKVYPAFTSTEYFAIFMQNADLSMQDESGKNHLYVEGERNNSVMGQTGYARNKLNQLQEKLNNKSQALQALKISLKPESKVLSGLRKEVENLEGEKRQLEAHLNRTEAWSEHLGKWRAVVQSAELPDDKEPLQFVLVVHVVEDEMDSNAISTGWVVLRKLSEFHELHRKLLQVWNGVKQLELPSQTPKFLFGKPSEKSNLEKAKYQIQKYLEFVLMDERLNASEALYTFLSPSSEYLKSNINLGGPSPKKNRFSFSTLFKSSNQPGNSENSRDSDDDELSLLDEDIKLNSVEGKDAIAEPLYALISEIFDLRGVFRWLRKTLIAFVQITYGRTINRQIMESTAWLLSEQMLFYYIQILTQSWWPNGVLVNQLPNRSEEEISQIRLDAKIQFLNNIPEVLSNLVGQQNARRGALKIFEILQDYKLNKQLYYDLLELLVYEIFPELKKSSSSTSIKRNTST